jgi:hypothetical protein
MMLQYEGIRSLHSDEMKPHEGFIGSLVVVLALLWKCPTQVVRIHSRGLDVVVEAHSINAALSAGARIEKRTLRIIGCRGRSCPLRSCLPELEKSAAGLRLEFTEVGTVRTVG